LVLAKPFQANRTTLGALFHDHGFEFGLLGTGDGAQGQLVDGGLENGVGL